MVFTDAELVALAQRVAELIQADLVQSIIELCSQRTIQLAQQNGERIARLEQAVAQINGVEFHLTTVEALLHDGRFDQLVGRGFEAMVSHATGKTSNNVQAWLGNPFLTSQEAAKIIGVNKAQMVAWRKHGGGPKWSGTGKMIRYERLEIERWLREMPTSD